MLEELLKEQIRHDPEIAGMLAVYASSPAVFYQKSPEDTERGWQDGCFPRIDYLTSMRYDPERKVSGILEVNIWCQSENSYMPEDIERRIVELIGGTFYRIHNSHTCAIWSRSDAFEFDRGNIRQREYPDVFGMSVIFDLLEFPEQTTSDPDPIQGLNNWTKANYPEAIVVNCEDTAQVWRPKADIPAIYWRVEGYSSTDRQSYSATWYSGQFAAHVMTGEITERNRWLRAIVERIQLSGEIILADGSPMFIRQITARAGADPLREGQIVLSAQYAVNEQLRKERAQYPLNTAVYPHGRTEVKNG